MKRKCAVFTTVKNENVFLPIWLQHYQQFFDNSDIYVMDHHSSDGSTSGLPVNVRLVSNDLVNDHDWLAQMAQGMQRELLERYECVLFAEGDELVYAIDKPLDKKIDEFLKSDHLYITVNGFSVHQDLSSEAPLQPGDLIFEKRRHWYKDRAEDKTLLTKIPIEWKWGFHELKDRDVNYHPDFFLAHLHRFDLELMIKRHLIRTSFAQKNDGAGYHWRSDLDEIHQVFRFTSSTPEPIPEAHLQALKHLVLAGS